jgi:hypothetical protein
MYGKIFKESHMHRSRHRYLICLGLMVLMGIMAAGLEARAQLNVNRFLDQSWGDYTWGAYGGSREASRLGREDLVARENYCSSNGCVLRLDQVRVLPPTARRGEILSLATTYTILTPDQVAIPITISREIMFQGKTLGRTKSMETRRLNGTWSHEVDFKLPANATPGTYILNTRVSTGYGMDQKSTEFQVF